MRPTVTGTAMRTLIQNHLPFGIGGNAVGYERQFPVKSGDRYATCVAVQFAAYLKWSRSEFTIDSWTWVGSSRTCEAQGCMSFVATVNVCPRNAERPNA